MNYFVNHGMKVLYLYSTKQIKPKIRNISLHQHDNKNTMMMFDLQNLSQIMKKPKNRNLSHINHGMKVFCLYLIK